MRLARPNEGHRALSRGLQQNIHGIITQNVDDLLQQASCPSEKVVHLHGTIHYVVCLRCGSRFSREEVQFNLEKRNPLYKRYVDVLLRGLDRRIGSNDSPSKDGEHEWEDFIGSEISQSLPSMPDGDLDLFQLLSSQRPHADTEIPSSEHFYHTMLYLSCHCGGILKPDVVFYGGTVDKSVLAQVEKLLTESDFLLVIGTSLSTWSAYRIVKAVKDKGIQCAILNDGWTRADEIVGLKSNGRCGITLKHLFG